MIIDSQFLDRVIAMIWSICMYVTFLSWIWRLEWRPISFPADQGLLPMKTSSARWKSRGERDSISDRRSGRRNYVTAVLSRATSRLFLFYSLTHVRIIDSRAYTCHIVALLLLRGEGSACKGRWNKIRWERSGEGDNDVIDVLASPRARNLILGKYHVYIGVIRNYFILLFY